MKSVHLLLTSAFVATCFFPVAVHSAVEQQSSAPILINGMAPVTVSRKPTKGATKPEFTSITVMPGRGMEVQQITAWFPGKGELDVLASPSLTQTAEMLNDHDTPNGDLGYRLGAAFLFPYPNRIRGKLSPDGKMLTTEWQGHPITIPANNVGSRPGAERHAMHGLILKGKVSDVKVTRNTAGGVIIGLLHCGDFDGHWFSKTDLVYSISLTAEGVDVSITAHNVGVTSEPVAIAWHPYFNLPSGDRKQVRLRIPASAMAEVDNYDDVFPTGKILPVAGTAYDFQAADGKPLGGQFLDDNFSSLERKGGPVVVTVTDPAAHYGVKIEGLSPEIRTIQVYAPPAKNFVAVEDQFNFGDPFGKAWGTMNTGMVTLAPGKSTRWHVRLELMQP
uniref:Aldose 1-epimerase n=1 Tax=mine drainage metagenome TaxID=410659 RepID=E6QJR6_9ZZZZ